jgi:hypothetical protein
LVVNNEGIRLVVDDQHNQQGSAYFKYEQFSDYNLRVTICNLRIPLNIFMVMKNGCDVIFDEINFRKP